VPLNAPLASASDAFCAGPGRRRVGACQYYATAGREWAGGRGRRWILAACCGWGEEGCGGRGNTQGGGRGLGGQWGDHRGHAPSGRAGAVCKVRFSEHLDNFVAYLREGEGGRGCALHLCVSLAIAPTTNVTHGTGLDFDDHSFDEIAVPSFPPRAHLHPLHPPLRQFLHTTSLGVNPLYILKPKP
jgi:hypothetical protein